MEEKNYRQRNMMKARQVWQAMSPEQRRRPQIDDLDMDFEMEKSPPLRQEA